MPLNIKALLGCVCIFLSAFFFYLATVTIRWSKIAGLAVDPAFFVFSRFILGFVVVLLEIWIRKQKIVVVKKQYLILRALTNCIAVFCFFKAVSLTSVVQANILNMTYPLFIAVFSWIFLNQKQDKFSVLIVAAAFAGVWLILAPGKQSFDMNALWGLGSGISAAVSIIYLNLSRKVHDTHTTLFFLFGLGSVFMLVFFSDRIHIPQSHEFFYLILCSVLGIAGQYLITLGFKYVTAVEGGIISSTRILLAAVLGPFIAMDPVLTAAGWSGAFLIFGANVYLAYRKSMI